MTEAEWLKCDDLELLLNNGPRNLTDRTLRHLMVAPVVDILRHCEDKNWRDAIRCLDQFAAGIITRKEFDSQLMRGRKVCATFTIVGFPWGSEQSATTLHQEIKSAAIWYLRFFLPPDSIVYGEEAIWEATRTRSFGSPTRLAAGHLAFTLHDIFGNPFRPVTFDPAWRTATAIGVAQTMYDTRDFGAMPILADALEDAGCEQAEILSHCRGDGPHVRGCWVVDLVLGKE
jgi:hypothetical protein